VSGSERLTQDVTDTSPYEASERVAPAEASGLLTIDLGALAGNWQALRQRAVGAECSAVVKADAYGIGLEPAVRALDAAGCRTFFVAHLSEAVRAREVNAGATIYVLNGLLPGTSPTYAVLDLRPVLGSHDDVVEWSSFCAHAGRAFSAAVHVDTGMNRLGLRPEEAMALAGEAELLAPFHMALLMTHLVSAEEPDAAINARQVAAFTALRQRFAGVPASFCNSAGIFLPGNPHFDLVRPGYALYGGNPTPGRANPMSPVVKLEGRILQLRTVEAGETVGYNAQWTARAPRRIATIGIGYADGYPRNASATETRAGGAAMVAGRRCPFAGRVSMDLISIDVTDVPAAALGRGATLTLIGDGLGVDEVGANAMTTGYEILTNLGDRYARTYVGG
jgi:alanine racemase